MTASTPTKESTSPPNPPILPMTTADGADATNGLHPAMAADGTDANHPHPAMAAAGPDATNGIHPAIAAAGTDAVFLIPATSSPATPPQMRKSSEPQ